ncbi:Mn2+ homeostasis protein Per1 [Metarhizium album ARSEF 1941]|uniref:Post-GPI attachment to proteins factor 3 n=1 Tax=Metarhizium album (strain ARSEF 1941) TaxID=1081103 RepID=A0A0B2WQN6_METAS|nr:Mn2+ homeostasis protein Per1 [Metarhizium album ARSEF 1941]KHN95275.1 Mn2+ homeostasis protein Per1 [Metarhizium album ARSEF 1941]
MGDHPILVLPVPPLRTASRHVTRRDPPRSEANRWQVCKTENCGPGKGHTPIRKAAHRRLLLWNCASECDYTCQHIVTAQRVAAGDPIVQFHGKWPFYRFLGMQEPFSVLFSLGNLYAHWHGLAKVRARIPATYSLRPFYVMLAQVGIASWVFSAIFHTRDFQLTEELDYFAAGASVLYGLYYTPIRIFRIDRPSPRRRSALRVWTLLCIMLYVFHVAYLKGVRWDYAYNMAANVAAGIVQNILWSWFSVTSFKKSGSLWSMVPGVVVAWVMFAMSMELFDFPPWLGCIDAHSLWHLLTIGPTVLWYNFLLKDAQQDIAGTERHKA